QPAAQVRSAATGEPVTPLLQHAAAVYSALFSPDGSRVLTASADGTAGVWDARTGARLLPPIKHRAAVLRAVFSPDGRRIATASADGTARVWDAITGQPVTLPLQHRVGAHPPLAAGANHVQFSPDTR